MQLLKESKKKNLVTIIFFVLLILLFLSWLYVFNVYEVKTELHVEKSPYYKIDIIPINSLGIKSPFRNVKASYEILIGKKDINTIVNNINRIIISAKKQHGLIKLKISTDKTQNKTIIEIPPIN